MLGVLEVQEALGAGASLVICGRRDNGGALVDLFQFRNFLPLAIKDALAVGRVAGLALPFAPHPPPPRGAKIGN